MNAHERYLFDTLGYIAVPDVIGADEVAELNRYLDEYDLWAQAERGELQDLWSNDSKFISGGRPHTWDEPFRRLIEHPTILSYLRELIGPHVREVARGLAADLLGERPGDRPTAIFAASDTQALGVLEAARAAGVDVPGELSVVGFDDIEVSGYAGLTTVRQPLFESGRAAVALLLDALGSEDRPPAVVSRLDLELVERSTTGPPPARSSSRRTVHGQTQGGSP